MKNVILKFLVSRMGGIVTPIIAVAVGAIVARLASYDPNLAGSIKEGEVTAFIVALIISVVNYYTNAVQTDGVKKIQAMVNTTQDGVPGPVTYTEVRKAIPVEQ